MCHTHREVAQAHNRERAQHATPLLLHDGHGRRARAGQDAAVAHLDRARIAQPKHTQSLALHRATTTESQRSHAPLELRRRGHVVRRRGALERLHVGAASAARGRSICAVDGCSRCAPAARMSELTGTGRSLRHPLCSVHRLMASGQPQPARRRDTGLRLPPSISIGPHGAFFFCGSRRKARAGRGYNPSGIAYLLGYTRLRNILFKIPTYITLTAKRDIALGRGNADMRTSSKCKSLVGCLWRQVLCQA